MVDGGEDGHDAGGHDGIFRDTDDETRIEPGHGFSQPSTPVSSPGPAAAGLPGAMPPPPVGAAAPGYPVPVILVAPPAVTTTVLVTLFFGLFGLIPASRHSQRAQQMGLDGGKYWKAFGITFGSMTAVNVLALVLFPMMGLGLFAGLMAAAGGGNSSSSGYQPTSYSQPTYSYQPTSYEQPSVPPVDDPTFGSTDSASDIGDHPALAGSWVAVLDSFEQSESDISEARGLANRISTKYGVQVSVLDSGDYSGLNSGYWAVVLTGFSSNEQARAACSSVGREPSGACYGRHIAG